MSTKSDVVTDFKAEVSLISSQVHVEELNNCRLHGYHVQPPSHINFHRRFVLGFWFAKLAG